jgi:hypothetical protein
MSQPAEPKIENLSQASPASGFAARALRLLGVVFGLVVAVPLGVIFGLLRGLRWLARAPSLLAALARRLARSPLPARLLALGGMLSVLTLALAAFGSDGATVWDARIGTLIGGGAALMALPKWLGWPERTLRAVVVLVLLIWSTGLATRLFLGPLLPAGMTWILRASDIGLALVFGACVLVLTTVFHARRAPLVGTIASGLGGLLLVGVGVECIGVGVTAWVDLFGGVSGVSAASGDLGRVLLAASALWIVALLISRLEARQPYRWAGRLLALRSLLLRLGGVAAGVAVGVWSVPAASGAAWTAAFATPLEGLAPALGYVAGALTGALVAASFVVLPMLMARLQLAGRLAASAAGEAGWFAALALFVLAVGFMAGQLPAALNVTAEVVSAGVSDALVTLSTTPSSSALESSVPPVVAMHLAAIVLATLAHTAIRLLLGRVPEASATPLWLFIPEAVPARATVDCALRAAKAWAFGPVTLVAPPPVARQVRGAHLRLAQQAGALPALFVNRPAPGADWRRLRLPSAKAWSGLPCSELYGAAAAWQAALPEKEANARVLVVVGDSALGWNAAFFNALPAGSELLAHRATALPKLAAGVVRDSADFVDFAAPETADDWLARFLQRNAPPRRPSRRLLIVHREDDALLAERLAAALDDRVDAAGRQVVASTLDTRPSAQLLLRLDSRTWQTLIGLAARLAASLGAAPRAGLVVRLAGMVARYVVALSDARIDLVVVESAQQANGDASTALGLERDADSVVALLPADAPPGLPRLYPPAAYSGALQLPPPSAQDDAGIAAVAARLLAGEVSSAPPGPADTAAPPPPVRVFLVYVKPYETYRDLLAGALRERGLDVVPDATLKAGEVWHDTSFELLAGCRVQVVLCGSALAGDRFAMRDVEAALERKLTVIPVAVAAFVEPRALRERQFANRQFLQALPPHELSLEIAHSADEIARVALSIASADQAAQAATAGPAAIDVPDRGAGSA